MNGAAAVVDRTRISPVSRRRTMNGRSHHFLFSRSEYHSSTSTLPRPCCAAACSKAVGRGEALSERSLITPPDLRLPQVATDVGGGPLGLPVGLAPGLK